jgi:hypothetical protein
MTSSPLKERVFKDCSEAELKRQAEVGYKFFIVGEAIRQEGKKTGDMGWEVLGLLVGGFVAALGAGVCVEVGRERRIRRRWPVRSPEART